MLRGLGDLKDMGAMLKKVMDLKNQMETVKESLANEIITGTAAAGEVSIVMNGKMQVVEVKIAPSAMQGDDPALLEAYVQAAVNDAVSRAQTLVKEKMAEMTGGLDIPGLT
ncbi:MAG: YbaB/EbfC family nucleoid-associated protein [Candidatus Hydrogenedens sp.]|nr:YbaB/EbfC family nucleoid-associated protein [Candidatus Hydrogenedens sp.]